MTKMARARYTLEFKQEAVRLVEAGQSIRPCSIGSRRTVKANLPAPSAKQSAPSKWRSAGCAPSYRA